MPKWIDSKMRSHQILDDGAVKPGLNYAKTSINIINVFNNLENVCNFNDKQPLYTCVTDT